MPIEHALRNVDGIEKKSFAGFCGFSVDKAHRINKPISPLALKVSRVPYPKYGRCTHWLPFRGGKG